MGKGHKYDSSTSLLGAAELDKDYCCQAALGHATQSITSLFAGGTLLWTRNANHLQMARTDPFGRRRNGSLLELPYMIALLALSYNGLIVTGFRIIFRVEIMPFVVVEDKPISVDELVPTSFLADGVGPVVVSGLTSFFLTLRHPDISGVWSTVVAAGTSCYIVDLIRLVAAPPPHGKVVLTFITLQCLAVIALSAVLFGAAILVFRALPKQQVVKRFVMRFGFHEPQPLPLGVLLGYLFLSTTWIPAVQFLILSFKEMDGNYDRSVGDEARKHSYLLLLGGVISLVVEIVYLIAWRWWRAEGCRVDCHMGRDMEEWTSLMMRDSTQHYTEVNIFSSHFLERSVKVNKQVHAVTCASMAFFAAQIFVGGFWINSQSMFVDAIGAFVIAIASSLLFQYIRQTEYSSWKSCPSFRHCAQFVKYGMSIDFNLFLDEAHHRCMCSTCGQTVVGESERSAFYAGDPPQKYVLPLGWSRFGVKVDKTFAHSQQVWRNWNKAFHGTAWNSVSSVLQHHQLLLPGDILLDGTQLKIREGHVEDQLKVFTTPTILYASRNYYALPVKWGNSGSVFRVVLECVQQPESIAFGPETIGWSQQHPDEPFDSEIPNDKIEWSTSRRVAILITGILVRDDALAGEDGRGDYMLPEPESTVPDPASYKGLSNESLRSAQAEDGLRRRQQRGEAGVDTRHPLKGGDDDEYYVSDPSQVQRMQRLDRQQLGTSADETTV